MRAIAISASAVLAAIASVILAFWGYYRFVPPAAGAARPEEAAAFAAAAADFSGRIVWSSNRSGNHEIVLLDARSAPPRLVTLTRDAHVDTYPRFSPDGTKILFNRSRRPWVSARETDSWDVWIMNDDGSGARRVAEHGFHATFAPSGKAVIFTRGGRILRVKVDGGQERVLLDTANGLGERVYEPDLSRGRLALTIRGGHRTFGVYDPARSKYTEFPGPSCQIAWWPGGQRLYWVESTGRGGNRVVSGNAKGGDTRTLIDLQGEYSHEYFPRVSRDGSWLVLGASAGGHEHDRADYEIFLWKVGEPAERARRLTHHGGNDQWPDVFVATAASDSASFSPLLLLRSMAGRLRGHCGSRRLASVRASRSRCTKRAFQRRNLRCRREHGRRRRVERRAAAAAARPSSASRGDPSPSRCPSAR